MKSSYTRLKLACYTTNITMSVVGNLSPLLFLTFRSLYDISYTLLGLLILINFVTQLTVDLIFSFFSHKFNIPFAVKSTPMIAVVGLIFYAMSPILFPQNVYVGLVIGTIIFSASSGFAEVLISPVIAAIPSKDPDREMSKLHSIYAWGVVFVVIVSTLFLFACGAENWQWLALFFAMVPLVSFALFVGSEIPPMETQEKISGVLTLLKDKKLWISFFAIFLGGAAECTMAQWSSGYIEQALGIQKVWGDIFGVALFAVMLGLGRSLYAKFGKNIRNILIVGAIGASSCYLIAALVNIPVIGLIACAFTGFCVSMLWPGNLVVAAERFPVGGVFIYAMMAAGGDLGASVAPQLVGVLTDIISEHPSTASFAETIGLMPEQLGMKVGMLCGALFPIVAIPLYLHILKSDKHEKKANE